MTNENNCKSSFELTNICFIYEFNLCENFEIENHYIIVNDNEIMIPCNRDLFDKSKKIKYIKELNNTYKKCQANESSITYST